MVRCQIRKLGLKYAPVISDIENICFTSPWNISMIEGSMTGKSSAFYGYFEEGRLVGYIGLLFTEEFCDILNIAVLPQYRNKGIGTSLLLRADKEFEKRKISKVFLEVRASSDAVKLYEKNGYKVYSERKGYYKNPTEDAILMIKDREKK